MPEKRDQCNQRSPNIKMYFRQLSRKQLVLTILIGLVFLVITAFSYVLIKREALLKTAMSKVEKRMLDDYQLVLHVGSARFTGFRTVTLEQISINQLGHSDFLNLEKVAVSVRLLPLLNKQVEPASIDMVNAHVNLIKRDSTSNYGFLFERPTSGTEHTSASAKSASPRKLDDFVDRLLRQVFDKVPNNMDVSGIALDFVKDSLHQTVLIPELSINKGRISSEIYQENRPAWKISGQIKPSARQIYAKIERLRDDLKLPFLDQYLDLEVSFSSFEFRLANVEKRQNLLHLQGETKVKGLLVDHWRISSDSVDIPEGFLAYEVGIGNDYIELGPSSMVEIQNLTLHPTFKMQYPEAPVYDFAVQTPMMPAQDLFDAFPRGLFTTLEGIRVGGELQYQMKLHFDTKQPDSVAFDSAMIQKGFAVNHWGNLEVGRLNGSFIYEPENSARQILVGSDNPGFIGLASIPAHLKNAVLTTEDPSFYYHKGFVMESIRESIAINYKERAFKRGASTISMQLAKNLFLNRNKTMVRKLEEVIIVWLIENNRALSKDRMFEIYLNIIEWGNGVYGIKEAAQYYFGKHPSQLSIGESIYLASIIPRPRTGVYAFEYTGRLKPHLESYFNFVGNIMVKRGLINPDSVWSYGFGDVLLREPLRPNRPAGPDTLILAPPALHYQFDPNMLNPSEQTNQ